MTFGDARAPGVRPVRTPKLAQSVRLIPTPGSQYYAGYDPGFVADLLDHLDLSAGCRVLDPWNGGGTTTAVVRDSGRVGVGFDLNPVLVLVGKARLLGFDAVESLSSLTHEVLKRAREDDTPALPDEPLRQWFTKGTACYVRAIERGVRTLMVDPSGRVDLLTSSGLDQVSNLAGSFYVVLFETVRSFLGRYRTTNPTWLKVSDEIKKLSMGKDAIDARFRATEALHHARLLELDRAVDHEGGAVVRLGDSTALALSDGDAHACITSPPYLTRIDYAVLTRPELAVLGVGDDPSMRALRDATIGTTTMSPSTPCPDPVWGTYTTTLLDAITGHKSKASAGYYRKYYIQYFDGMYRSLAEVRRVVGDGRCALVIQDSFYKDVHVDLARSLTEMGQALGWARAAQTDYNVPHLRARMNAKSRKYRSEFVAKESLLVLSA